MLIFKSAQVIKYYEMFAFLFVQTVFCRMAKNYKSCVPSLQLGANTNCTQDLANTVFNYFKITLNLTACGIKQEMPEFALYGGPVVCNNPPMLG